MVDEIRVNIRFRALAVAARVRRRGARYRPVRYLSGARTRLVNLRAAELLYFTFNTLCAYDRK